ncbi:hypothetical protein AB6G95_19390 [Proteus vulgaris]|uniref:hypothetical protein n=1 Tax=Proteus vulgaris TaxID=585 RepID=UPI0034DD63D8
MIDTLNYYQDLSPSAKATARTQVVACEAAAYKAELALAVSCAATSSIHSRISHNPNRIRALSNKLRLIRHYQTAPTEKVEKFIEENLCMFDACGRFYLFLKKAFFQA